VTEAQFRNLLIYAGVALLNMLAIAVAAALAGGTMPGFRANEFFEPAKGELVALLTLAAPILSTWLASNRPRFGSEQLAAEVGVFKDLGFHRDDLTVLPKGGRVPDPAIAPDSTAPAVAPRLSDEDIDRLARRGLELMRQVPPTEVKP
jgi:hypothetical protein